MPLITFIEHDGTEHAVDVPVGQTLMQAAVENSIPGILADCGGCCACATCHCYLGASWHAAVTQPNDDERSLLDVVETPTAESRLSCQLVMTEVLAGAVVRLPESQY